MKTARIQQTDNGYIFYDESPFSTYCHNKLVDVMYELLAHFEGKCKSNWRIEIKKKMKKEKIK